MNHWWRAHNEAVNDPKLQLISDSLFRAWFNLMCIASGNDGVLPDITTLSFTLRMKPEKVAQVLTQLCAAGLLDQTETSFAPHNWKGRQYKTDVTDVTNAERQKNFRKKRRDELNELKALRDTMTNGALRNGVSSVTTKRPDTDTDITSTSRSERGPGKGSLTPDLAAVIRQKGWVS